jgi:hypothetical protein
MVDDVAVEDSDKECVGDVELVADEETGEET